MQIVIILLSLLNVAAWAEVPSQRPYQSLFSGPSTSELVRRAPLEEGRVYTFFRMDRRTRIVDEVTQVWRHGEQTYSHVLERPTILGLNITGDAMFIAEMGFTVGGDLALIPANSNIGGILGVSYFTAGSYKDPTDTEESFTDAQGQEFRAGFNLRRRKEGGTRRRVNSTTYAVVRHLKYKDSVSYNDERPDLIVDSGTRWDYGAAVLMQAGDVNFAEQFTFSVELGRSRYFNNLDETRWGNFVQVKIGVRFSKNFKITPAPVPVGPTSHWR